MKSFISSPTTCSASEALPPLPQVSTFPPDLPQAQSSFAASRKEARQLVRHGHYTLNGKKANIPSILVKAGDVVSVAEGSRNSDKIKLVTEANASRPVPQWLDADKNQLTAKVVRLPAREDVDMDIEEQQIVEFYSK